MIVLHIGNVGMEQFSGVNIAVPKHIIAQEKYAEVAFVNINNIQINGIKTQLEYKGAKDFPNYLPEPYNNPDIVVFQEVNYIEYIKLYPQLLKKNIPYILFPHGEITNQALRKKWLKKKLAYTLFFNKFISNAAALQCLSQGEANDIKFANTKLIIPNGCDIPAVYNDGMLMKDIRILYIGRLDWYHKGLDLLFDALGMVRELLIKNNVILDIFGPSRLSADRQVIESKILANNLRDIVNINEPIFGMAKEKEFLSHDIFIQTSRFEGLPMGILEAMSYALPIIATEGTNMIDIIVTNDAGFTALNNSESIAVAIRDAINQKEKWTEKGLNGRRTVIKEFSWERIAVTSLQEYGKIEKGINV